MTESWVPIPAAAWPDIADAMTKPWPRWAVRFDLRWWADRERMGRAKRPGRPALCKRWGWGDKAARNVMAAVGEWADPRHGDPNPDKGKVREIQQGPAGVQPWSSEGPAGVQDSDDKCAESLGAGSSEGPAGVQQGSSKGPHARDTQTQAQDTGTEEQEDNPAATAPESGKPDDPIRALWDKWEPKRVEVYGGRVGKLTKARRSAMRARIKDHSAEEVGLVLAWWLTSSHERATFLRANGCTWDTVLRPTKFPGYLEMAGQAAGARQQRAAAAAAPALVPTSSPIHAAAWASGNRSACRDAYKAGGWDRVRDFLGQRVTHPDNVIEQLRRQGAVKEAM